MDLLTKFSTFFTFNSTCLLRLAIGINYFWFGTLKFFSGMSPAEGLATDTIRIITFGLVPDSVNLLLLAIWEVGVGILFLSGKFIRIGAVAAIVHMIFTFLPLFFFPEISFSQAPFGFSIVGQYIVKNLVFLAALGMILKEETEKVRQKTGQPSLKVAFKKA